MGSFSKSCLMMQGYPDRGDEALARLNLPLRFSPGLVLAGTTAATVTQSWIVFGALALVALMGSLFPAGHPFDLLFNHAVRHALRTEPLPPNPPPRRLAFIMSVPVLSGAAVGFGLGASPLGYTFAALQLAGSGIYVFTGLCVASWFYGATIQRRTDTAVHRSLSGS